MTPERWARIEQLYHEALGCDPHQRAAFLAAACAGDDALRREVESLLAHDGGAAFLSTPAVASGIVEELRVGQAVGPYLISARIGAGGMGEVYRARDTKLGRDVAIKILSGAFTADPDRLARFEREARLLASLNHPHIGAIYGLEESAGVRALVLELVEGKTLAERLGAEDARGQGLPISEALTIARQIADALDAAHERGIVHRDLKPANIAITSAGGVKVLDFGLAKVVVGEGSSRQLSEPTVTVDRTRTGMIVGTAAYMSPEQARGQMVDKRTDIWAFGCVLYEMLTGCQAFPGRTVSDTNVAVLEREPDWSSLPAHTPARARLVLRRCLAKDPKERLRDISDATPDLVDDDALSDASHTTTTARADSHRVHSAWLGWGAAALLVAMLAPLAYRHVRERPVASSPMRFQISPTVEFAGPGNFSLSPDGNHLAFVGRGADGIARIWVRAMDSLESRLLPGSETANITPPPFWSPDGRFVAFDAGGRLKKLDVSGGLPQTLCDLPGVAVGGSWNRDGDIIVGNTSGGLLRVRETGGAPTPITMLDPSRKEEVHLLPSFLPDGRHFVYLRISPSAPEAGGVYVGTLDAKAEEQSAQRLLPYEVGVTYVEASDSGPGRLLFLREGTLMAQSFDASRLALAGDPVPVAERVGSFRDGGFFSASANDVLVYRTAETDFQITWFDRQGAVSGRVSEPGGLRSVALSPDGTHAVASRTNPQDTAKADLWLFDLLRGGGATRLTLGTGIAESPVWSPDGQRIVFSFNNSQLRQKLASGEGDEKELLRANSVELLRPTSWSPDGRFLLYTGGFSTTKSLDVLVLPRNDPAPVPFMQTGFTEEQGRFSPNGQWIAYVSNESGVSEVYVREFARDFSSGSASMRGRVLVSRGGGTAPRWRGDGREILYLAPNGKMMAVQVKADQDFQAGTPTQLFQTPPSTIVGDVTADGKRFLLVTPVGPSASVPLTVVLNWTAGLKK
jgi:eukaryotic-like serine/threonine-protein kinase